VGFHIKNIFFLNQIKFFQGLGGVFLDEEVFPKEGIFPCTTKLTLSLSQGEITGYNICPIKYLVIIKCHHCSSLLISTHMLNTLESKRRRI